MSLYIDVKNFTDRAMVALTTLLVIATMTSSIQMVILIIVAAVFLAYTVKL